MASPFSRRAALTLFVLLAFPVRRFARRDEANLGAVRSRRDERVDHDDHLTALGPSDRHPTLFTLAMLLIIDRQRQRVTEHRHGGLETHSVLAGVGLGLLGVPVELVGGWHAVCYPAAALFMSLPRSMLVSRTSRTPALVAVSFNLGLDLFRRHGGNAGFGDFLGDGKEIYIRFALCLAC